MNTVLVIGATSPTAQAFIKLMERDYPEMVDCKINPNAVRTKKISFL
ncbi:hypothetical protein [Lactiplantibacillus plantarum]|nr:hypothetical protein [Lactiplantibacillus plantarum]